MRLSDGAVVPGNAQRRRGRDRAPHRPLLRPLRRGHPGGDRARGRRGRAAGLSPSTASPPSGAAGRGPGMPGSFGISTPASPIPASGLRAEEGLVVGDNEPYDGALAGDTVDRHATGRGLANALIEIRQDLIAGDEGARHGLRASRGSSSRFSPIRPCGFRPPIRADARAPAPPLTETSHDGDRPGDPDRARSGRLPRLVEHLRERADVQNIDLMNLAGFCRNCLSNWLQEAADGARPCRSPRTRAGRSSTACPTRSGRRTIRPKRRRPSAPPSRRRNRAARLFANTGAAPKKGGLQGQGQFMDDAAFSTEFRRRRPAQDPHRAHRAPGGGEGGHRRRHQGDLRRGEGQRLRTKAIRKIVSLRKKDYAQRQEEEAVLELYMQALGMA